MLTDIAMSLIMRGKLDVDTVQLRALILNRDVNITKLSTSADSIINSADAVVTDANIPAGGIPCSLTANKSGVYLNYDTTLVKMAQANQVGAVLVHVVGTIDNTSNPIVAYETIAKDYYYNISLESGLPLLTLPSGG